MRDIYLYVPLFLASMNANDLKIYNACAFFLAFVSAAFKPVCLSLYIKMLNRQK